MKSDVTTTGEKSREKRTSQVKTREVMSFKKRGS